MDTLATLELALESAPQDPALHWALAAAYRTQGDELAALAHQIAAKTLEAPPPRSAINLCNVATGYFMKGEHKTAARWYRLVLQLDPEMAIPYMNLASICADAGLAAEAEACRARAYAIQRVFVEQESLATRRVLMLSVGRTSGNVALELMLPTSACSRIKYIIDYADEAEDARLPPYDLVFNAIGEPDVAALLEQRVAGFVARCGRLVLNQPAAVIATQRHRMPALFADLDGVVTAPCLRYDCDAAQPDGLAALLAGGGLDFPVLMRPAGTHGGDRFQRCETLEELRAGLEQASGIQYLTSYRDYRSADGHYRKYRVIFVDGQPYAYHLAISERWMVHYFSADMQAHPWKIAEEQRYLDDMAGVLGPRAMAALAAIGARLGLDYAGIDFTLLPDGSLFVFEANATMLVHRERANGILAHKNVYVQRIVDAFERMLARHETLGRA